jgi:hypothetical protein
LLALCASFFEKAMKISDNKGGTPDFAYYQVKPLHQFIGKQPLPLFHIIECIPLFCNTNFKKE